jgi:hypothetical protein
MHDRQRLWCAVRNVDNHCEGVRVDIGIRGVAATALAIAFGLAGGEASAQATRTWVSGVGDDVNPCSRTAPCKTFAGAISKTAAGGEINAIDPGGFGAVTITKSITIDGASTNASILASATNGIVVNGANIVVTIRNVSINGAGVTLGVNGVRFLQGASLTLHNVVIQNFSAEGVKFAPSSNADLAIIDSTIRGAGGGGVLVQPGVGFAANAMIKNTTIEGTGAYAIRADDRSTVSVKGSVLYSNGTHGVNANAASGPVDVAVVDTISSNNGLHGFLAQVTAGGTANLTISNSSAMQNLSDGVRSTGGAIVRLAGSTVARNGGTGMNPTGGQILSAGNNLNHGNGAAGGPSGVIGMQ